MSPLDLPGPQFLVFYLIFFAVLCLVLFIVLQILDATQTTGTGTIPHDDPYQIACLRGGRRHLISVVLMTLTDRKLLTSSGKTLHTKDPNAVQLVRRPIEKAVLEKYQIFSDASSAYNDDRINVAAEAIDESLQQAGLVPTPAHRRLRLLILFAAMLLVWLVGGTKLIVALQRGRHNVAFLIMLTCSYSLILGWRISILRTAQGSELLRNLKSTYQHLVDRRDSITSGGAGTELTLLMAIYGLGQLPTEFRKQARSLGLSNTNESGFSGCGGGCGGGGSSCGGGGGCGGGGCGGCGS